MEKLTRQLPLFAALLLLQAGCSTTIESTRVPPKADVGKEVGMIYQLTKPQFTVALTAPTDAAPVPKYTLQMENVPDPSERWGVRVKPGAFDEVDVSVAMTGDGVISNLTESSREQITPTIKTIGDFAGSIIGAAASTAAVMALDATPPKNDKLDVGYYEACEIARRLDAVHTAQTSEATAKKAKGDQAGEAKATAIAVAADQLTKKLIALKATIADPNPAVHLTPVISSGDIKTALKPANQDEIDAVDLARIPNVVENKSAQSTLKSAVTSFVSIYSQKSIANEAFLVGGEVTFAAKHANLVALSTFSTRNSTDQSADGLSLDKDAKSLTSYGMLAVTKASNFSDLFGEPTHVDSDAQKALAQARKARTDQLASQAQLAIETDPTKRATLQAKIAASEKAFYASVAAESEYTETLKLRGLIASGPPTGVQSPLQEYTLARVQLTALDDAVTKKLNALIADAEKPQPKAAEWDPKPVERAFVYNPNKILMEGGKLPAPRVLQVPNSTPDLPAEVVAGRVAEQFKEQSERWPTFVVTIDKVQP